MIWNLEDLKNQPDLRKRSGVRLKTWYWSIWWWIGYHGLYQINWAWKRWKKGEGR